MGCLALQFSALPRQVGCAEKWSGHGVRGLDGSCKAVQMGSNNILRYLFCALEVVDSNQPLIFLLVLSNKVFSFKNAPQYSRCVTLSPRESGARKRPLDPTPVSRVHICLVFPARGTFYGSHCHRHNYTVSLFYNDSGDKAPLWLKSN